MIPFVCHHYKIGGDYTAGIIMDTSLESARERFRTMLTDAGWYDPYIEVKMAQFDSDGYCEIEDHC